MTLSAVVGALAVVLTTAGWVPQIHRALTSRSVADFSLTWLVLFGSGVTAWLVYGLINGDAAIIAANTMAVLAMLTLAVIRWQSRVAAQPVAAQPVVDGPDEAG